MPRVRRLFGKHRKPLYDPKAIAKAQQRKKLRVSMEKLRHAAQERLEPRHDLPEHPGNA